MKPANFDAVAVQSAGLRKNSDGTYAPTLYTDSDDFGMLGGFIRVHAAEELYWQGAASNFIFCNGKSAKEIAKFGPDVPTDAEIYGARFSQAIRDDSRAVTDTAPAPPQVFLENTSVNTAASINEIISLCETENWRNIALISSDYHIPRIEALCGMIFRKLGNKPVNITFLSAEAVVRRGQPGVYDDQIQAAYQSPKAQKRIRNEQKGLNDIAAGRYHLGEFQLATKS